MNKLSALRNNVRSASIEAQDAAYAAQASALAIRPVHVSQLADSLGPPPETMVGLDNALFPVLGEDIRSLVVDGKSPPALGEGESAAEPGQEVEDLEAEAPPEGGITSANTVPPAPTPAEMDAKLQELSKQLAELAAAESQKAAELRAKEDAAQAELETFLREENSKYLNKLGRATFMWSLVTFLAALVLGTVARLEQGRVKLVTPADMTKEFLSGHTPLAVAALAAIILWLVLWAISRWKKNDGGLVGMLIGADGRFSTSYFQVWVWTLVLVWTFLFFVLMAIVGGEPTTFVDTDGDLGINADYLLLLGGPFAALVVARQVDQSKLLSGDLQKSTTSTAQVSDLFSTDSGRTDLVDMQYLLFNFVALIVFFGHLWNDPTDLPDIPDSLMLLTSGAALGYVARKAVQRNTPFITSIVPQDGDNAPTTGKALIIRGSHFIPSGAEEVESIRSVFVKFNVFSVRPSPEDPSASRGENVPPSLRVDGMTTDSIRVIIPDLSEDGLTERMVNVSVVTAPGLETAAFQLRVASPILRVRLEPIAIEGGIATITLTLLDPAMRRRPVRITVSSVPFDTFWIDDKAVVRVNSATAQAATLSVACGGATFSSQIALPA